MKLLLRNRTSVIYPEIFRVSYRKNYALVRKMIAPYLMVSTLSLTMQSLGKIILCAPAVGAKIWCLCFFTNKCCKVATCRYLFLFSRQNSTFCPLAENYKLDSKIVHTFQDEHKPYHHAKFGGDRTMHTGCMCKKCGVCIMNVSCFLSCSEAGALFV